MMITTATWISDDGSDTHTAAFRDTGDALAAARVWLGEADPEAGLLLTGHVHENPDGGWAGMRWESHAGPEFGAVVMQRGLVR